MAPPDPAAVERAGATARATVRGAALVAGGLWFAVTLVGHLVSGPLTASGPVGPAGVGAALLLAAVRAPVRRWSAVGGAVALTLLTGGLALIAGDASPRVAGAVLLGGAVVAALTSRGDAAGTAAAVLGLVGMVVLVGGLVRLATTGAESALLTSPGTGGMLLAPQPPEPATAALLALGATAVAMAGALRPRSVAAPLLPVGLAVGVAALAALGPTGDAVALVLGAAAAAAAGAWAARPSAGPQPMVGALALLALAAAAGDAAVPAGLPSGSLPAAWLLAASAVVTAVALSAPAALSAVPGAAALTAVLVSDPEPARLALVVLVLTAATLAAVAVDRGRAEDGGGLTRPGAGEHDPGPLLAGVPAVVIGAWLVVAPGTWSWAGAPALEGWSEGLTLAFAGGLAGAVGVAALGRVAVPDLPRLVGPDPEPSTAGVPAPRRPGNRRKPG